ncbi:Prefoldin subunit 3 [Labeo rohita]|uniref:Prefoldin subunit 3 n=1 Tax=Labeo rohita TaxID=84645 RepID=A0ABQ8MJ56_LABRO|nr:Prefoldin subunit 3 [Labeo rohita]
MATTIESGNAGAANKKKHLGIPEAIFVEDVDAFMKQPGNDTADAVLRKLDEQYQKYKYMELNLAQKKLRTLQIPWRHIFFWLITSIAKPLSHPQIKCALLEKNLATASRNLDSLEEDLDFLRDQFTTTEVNMARVYNWDVKRRSKDNLLKSAERS